MVSVAEASSLVFKNLFRPSIESIPFQSAVNRILAEKITADRDFPPADRVSMDGIAIAFSAWDKGQRQFAIEGVQPAGLSRKKLNNEQHCIEVMTGAVMPEGCDTVIQYEHLEIREGLASVTIPTISKGQSIHRQGNDARKEDVLLEEGIVLSPAEVALLAAVGKSFVKVFAFPRTAIISSGDELIAVDDVPSMHQIRRSNAYAIQSAMETLGWKGEIFHLRDEKEEMSDALREIAATFEVIILSGGVSKGKFDYVPAVLEEIGVRKLFHRVNQRPGKPFWFGVSDQGTTVFALPGNPVSTYMCFYRYIRPWVLTSMKVKQQTFGAVLATDFSTNDNITYFLQVGIKNENGILSAYPAPGGGSGDFANLKNVTGFLELPAEQTLFQKGQVFNYFPFRNF